MERYPKFENLPPPRGWIKRAFIPGFLGLICALSAQLFAETNFNRDVRPILSDNCLNCHGPDAENRKGGLRLDVREEALRPAKSGAIAIVPGDPIQSTLLSRIETEDRDEVMPPPKSHKRLNASQKSILRQWVSEGAKYQEHWAFIPPARPPVPAVKNTAWPRNPIDSFILARLEQESLAPAEPASPETLFRRLRFGLTGLPPTADEASVLAARHDEAGYSDAINRLLSSTEYGEHWARHWMDLARYADSAGFELDNLYSHAWQYRDWLIQSFTSNKPLDRFIQEQIAGDQLWPENLEAARGTFFLSIGPMRFEGGIQRVKERENDRLTDLADTTGSAFLGLTLGCTRCHDHKFDPLTQNDYYGLQAIFADSELKSEKEGKGGGNNDTRPAFVRVVLREKAQTVEVLRRGEVDLPMREAVPALPAILPGGGPLALASDQARRAALSVWLTSKENPLTARVLVNRIWQWHFGKGLVRTANDFGRQGEAPSHPALLDWLASELISSGWNLAHIHRLILESATYRQSSIPSAEALERDPECRLLARFPRHRLQAEELRDALLAVSGALNPESYGPPVIPPVEPWALAALRNKHWEVTKDESQARRRSLYLVVRRSIKLPFFDAFNSPDTISSCAGRDTTVVASQALTLLNSQDTLEAARLLAGRLCREAEGAPAKAVELAWKLVFSRPCTADEWADAFAFLQNREAAWAKVSVAPEALPKGVPAELSLSAARGAAWVEWCLALLNVNEFIYVD